MKASKKMKMMLLLFLVAGLSVPFVHSIQPSADAAGQNPDRSDVPQKLKQRSGGPRAPSGVAPANDNCASSISIASCPFTDAENTVGASDETNEPQSTCTLQGNSVWYSLTTGANEKAVKLDTCGSNFDTAVMVWQVNAAQPCNFASFIAVACNDDFSGCGTGLQSSVQFTAQANQSYKIQVGGFDGETGNLAVNVTCEELFCDSIVVNGNLGLGSPDYPSVSGQQTPNRLFRDGVPSTCEVPKPACPGTFSSGSFTFDAYTFTNESNDTQCVTVQYRPNIGCSTNAHATTYINSYDPTNVCLNYLADVGASDNLDYSFSVPAGANFVIVIAANNPGGVGNGCAYQFTVVGNICEQFDFCVQDDSTPTRFIKINSTTGAYEYHDCLKGVTVSGTGAVSRTECKINLSDSGPDPKRPDRSISVLVNPCTMRGDASIRRPGTTTTATLGDSNITNNTCECP